MKLIVGLGNPDSKYDNTRHNIGFMLVDYIIGKDNFIINKKMKAMEYITNINGEKVIIIKPITYMNLSGDAVINYINFYKISSDNVMVIQDDLDMPLGYTKLLFNRGDGGHNGIKDIMLKLGRRDFLRLKIGIDKSDSLDVKDYVLGKFNGEDLEIINDTFLNLRDIILDFVMMNRDSLMQKYNTKIHKE